MAMILPAGTVKRFLPVIFAVVMGLLSVVIIQRYLAQKERALK